MNIDPYTALTVAWWQRVSALVPREECCEGCVYQTICAEAGLWCTEAISAIMAGKRWRPRWEILKLEAGQ